MYYVPQIWTPLQKPFQNSKYARMRSQTLLNILDLPRDSRMFSKFFFLVPLKECQITNLRGISFCRLFKAIFDTPHFPQLFHGNKVILHIQAAMFFFVLFIVSEILICSQTHTQTGKSFCDLLVTELSEQFQIRQSSI